METELELTQNSELLENCGADFDNMILDDDGDGNDVYNADTAGQDGAPIKLEQHDEDIDLTKTSDKLDIDKQPRQQPAQTPSQQPVTKESLLEMLKDPAVAKMLADMNKPPLQEQLHKAPEQKPMQNAPTLDKLTFTPEEMADPQTFGKSIATKVMSMVDSMVAQKVSELMDYVEPIRGEYSRNIFQKECDAVVSEYGESARAYFTKDTPEYNRLADKFLNTPGITLKEAFVLLNPTKPADVKAQVDKAASAKATEIIKQKEAASTRVPVNRTPIVKVDNGKLSARDAALRALGIN